MHCDYETIGLNKNVTKISQLLNYLIAYNARGEWQSNLKKWAKWVTALHTTWLYDTFLRKRYVEWGWFGPQLPFAQTSDSKHTSALKLQPKTKHQSICIEDWRPFRHLLVNNFSASKKWAYNRLTYIQWQCIYFFILYLFLKRVIKSTISINQDKWVQTSWRKQTPKRNDVNKWQIITAGSACHINHLRNTLFHVTLLRCSASTHVTVTSAIPICMHWYLNIHTCRPP